MLGGVAGRRWVPRRAHVVMCGEMGGGAAVACGGVEEGM